MPVAEKGGRTQCFGTLPWRLFNKATRRRRHESASALRHADAGPAARDDCRRGVACPRTWQGSDWRYRLRLERVRTGRAQAGHECRDSLEAREEEEASVGPHALSATLSGRGLLSSAQAVSRHRHALREDFAQLPRTRPTRLRVAVAYLRSSS